MTDTTTNQTTPTIETPAVETPAAEPVAAQEPVAEPTTDPLAGTSLPAAVSTESGLVLVDTIGNGSKHDSIIAHLMDKFEGDIEAAELWVKTELAKL